MQCAYFVQTHFHIHIPLTPHMSESSNLYYNYTVGCRYMANACTLHAHLPSDSSSRIMCRLFSSSSFVHVFLFLFLFHLYFCLCWHFSYIACVYCFHDFCVLVVWLIFLFLDDDNDIRTICEGVCSWARHGINAYAQYSSTRELLALPSQSSVSVFLVRVINFTLFVYWRQKNKQETELRSPMSCLAVFVCLCCVSARHNTIRIHLLFSSIYVNFLRLLTPVICINT